MEIHVLIQFDYLFIFLLFFGVTFVQLCLVRHYLAEGFCSVVFGIHIRIPLSISFLFYHILDKFLVISFFEYLVSDFRKLGFILQMICCITT